MSTQNIITRARGKGKRLLLLTFLISTGSALKYCLNTSFKPFGLSLSQSFMHIFLTNVSLVHIHCDITHLSVSRVPTISKPFTHFGKLWHCPDCALLLILPTESDDPDGIESVPGSVSCRWFSFS